MTTYTAAREIGLLPPFALAVVAWKSAPSAARSIRSVNPAGAGLIFALAWLAGFSGSAAALLIVAALLAGLHLSTRVVEVPTAPIIAAPTASQPETVVAVASQVPTSHLAEALANGLVVRKLEFAQPAANGRAKAKVA